MSHQPELSGRPQNSPRSSSKPRSQASGGERVGLGGHVVPNFHVARSMARDRNAPSSGALLSCTIISGGGEMDVIVLLAAGKIGMSRLRLAPAVVGPFPDEPPLARLRLEADLERIVLLVESESRI